MRRGLLLIAALTVGIPALPSIANLQRKAVPLERTDLRPLLAAIRFVETGSRSCSWGAVGDRGRSIGPYQISRAYWQDSGVGGSWGRCRERAFAEAVMLAYWRRYCPEALRERDYETLARVHNGGPRGHCKAATQPYWKLVRARLTGRSLAPEYSRGAVSDRIRPEASGEGTGEPGVSQSLRR